MRTKGAAKAPGAMIEIDIAIERPEITLRLPAEADSLPLVRQALRSLGEAVEADVEALEDAELAVTEACANAVEHAYDGAGTMEVRLRPQTSAMEVAVRDSGRGMPEGPGPGGFGLSMIEGLAERMEVRPAEGSGTEMLMSFAIGGQPLCLNGHKQPGAAPAERIARRLVAVIAAQTNMPSDRLMESLLTVELAARHARRYLVGDRIEMSLERLEGGLQLRLGPLVDEGALALVRESELPVVGPVIERLADEVAVEPHPDGERLSLRIDSR